MSSTTDGERTTGDLPRLSPAQQKTYEKVSAWLGECPLVGLWGRNGYGHTTILRKLARDHDGRYVRLADVLESCSAIHPLQVEEGILKAIAGPLAECKLVVVDDFHVLMSSFNHCQNARPYLMLPVLDGIVKLLDGTGRQLVVGCDGRLSGIFHDRCEYVGVQRFTAEDIGFIFTEHLGPLAADLDFQKIYDFSPKLTANQIVSVARTLRRQAQLTTDRAIEVIESRAWGSNVDTRGVRAASLESLHGVDDVIKSLYVEVVVPLERADLTRELGLQAKRGVLLYGPPGTGKTTVGRALAHRLRNKFFLIDGTIISGTPRFFEVVNDIFEAAKACAPSIIFVDDSDLLFEDSEQMGLYRYLLTKLDGLQSDDEDRVTVMLTAMNLGSLPPALIRSGRVELWLEMHLPDRDARVKILTDLLDVCPKQMKDVDVAAVVESTDGLTGADLRRIVADAINLLGYDMAMENDVATSSEYFSRAVRILADQKEKLRAAPPFTEAHHGSASRRAMYYYAMQHTGKDNGPY